MKLLVVAVWFLLGVAGGVMCSRGYYQLRYELKPGVWIRYVQDEILGWHIKEVYTVYKGATYTNKYKFPVK